jgi:deazaflavin-dependent oxidoreductase (nitroreductase family)
MSLEKSPSGSPGARTPPHLLNKIFMPLMVRIHRRSGDRYQGMELLYLTTVGARSEQQRTNPVTRFDDGHGGWFIVASSAGSAQHPGWYHNIAAAPEALLRWRIWRDARETGVINSRSGSSAPAGYRFPREVIAVAVRWYLRYGLSYRDVEELLAERGIVVDHVTVYRWVQTFTVEFIDSARPTRHSAGDRWFVDEVRHEALVRREALETEGGASPLRRVVAAAW